MVIAPHWKEQEQHCFIVFHSAGLICTCFKLHNNSFCNCQVIIYIRKSVTSEFQHKHKEKGEAGAAITFPKPFTLNSMFGFREAFLFYFSFFPCVI